MATVDAVYQLLHDAICEIGGADGIFIARRDGDEIVMIAEDRTAPFWRGQRFALDRSLSGLAMRGRQPLLIPEIRNDARVPLNAYLASFVSTVAIFPTGNGEPAGAIGAYWNDVTALGDEAVFLLDALTRAAGSALEGLRLRDEVEALRRESVPFRYGRPAARTLLS